MDAKVLDMISALGVDESKKENIRNEIEKELKEKKMELVAGTIDTESGNEEIEKIETEIKNEIGNEEYETWVREKSEREIEYIDFGNEEKLKEIEKRNKELGIESITDENWTEYLLVNGNGVLKDDPENYRLIVRHDEHFRKAFKYNEFKGRIEYFGKPMSDDILASLIAYVSRMYGISNENRLFRNIVPSNMVCYHPIKDVIAKNINKDLLCALNNQHHFSYIDNFFEKICGCKPKSEEEKAYNREVARMIFYGGIKRLYEPGSKFDYMPIFESGQGKGKSGLVGRLNPISDSYVDLKSIDGSEGVECLSGGFIIEMSELLAFVRAREVEAMKSFITRQVDKYRPAYGRYVEELPRTCIFIGTTNDASFLTDVTGNRRFLPINLDNMKPSVVFSDETKKYILNCWSEALILYKENKIYTILPEEVAEFAESQISRYTIDDPMAEAIKDFITNYDPSERCYEDKICNIEIYTKCMSGIKKNFTRADAKYITNIINTCGGWERVDKSIRYGEYGPQKYWVKK